MLLPPRLQQLLAALRCLPGIGPKSAQRMALHLLERDRDGAERLSAALLAALEGVGSCRRCRMFAESELCTVCASGARDHGMVCVVETPADVVAIEESAGWRGAYFVLLGRLSPLDGVGPEEIGIPLLEERLAGGGLRELVIATSVTVEGEATAAFLAALARRHSVPATRIAHGVPMGGELEFVDAGTLSHALSARVSMAGDR
ncbi:MAG: recombination protein RecR [Chromatiales bacterium]|nr:recombination protein RecR [Chromatiales bacterium]